MAAALNTLADGAPVIVVEGSALIHVPTVYRLGKGSHTTPISTYARRGFLPLRWTTVCGSRGIVVVNRGEMMTETPVCSDCLKLSYHADTHDEGEL